MPRSLIRFVELSALISLLALWLSAAPGVSAGDPCYHDFAMPVMTTQSATQIKLMPCAFAPTVTQVATGSTVTFFNGPDFTHLITGANQAWGSRDVEVRPGQTVSYTFDKPGLFPYACALHRGMSGTIVVGDAAATAVSGGAAGAASGAAPSADATSGMPTDALLIGALAAGAGLLVGAAAVFVFMRPRRTDGSSREPADPLAGA
jgi:plastocyanin